VHEEPYIVAGNTQTLAEGMAFSVEPGIYLPGRWGARIEDIVIVTADGALPVNSRPHDLVVVD
jgi:Xaa-Pro aminopeptidase